jgi:hypothetical protein
MPMHQPDQALFRSVLPEDMNWQPFPAFPPSAPPGHRGRSAYRTRACHPA